MAIPVAPNTTCDIYRAANAPPAAPDAAGVKLFLVGDYENKLERGESQPEYLRYTHVAQVELSVDVRDGFGLWGAPFQPDHLYVPDKNGTEFQVTMVERRNRGQATEHKRVYLHRTAVTWPTNEL